MLRANGVEMGDEDDLRCSLPVFIVFMFMMLLCSHGIMITVYRC